MNKNLLNKFASFGYGAKGVIYLIIGGLSLLDALEMGGSTEDSKGALKTILEQPFGKFLLGIMAVGLVGYSLWRAVQAIADADDHGTDAKGIVVRGGLLVSSITHGLLTFWIVQTLLGIGGSGGTKWYNTQWASYLYLIGGIFIILAGVSFIYKGWIAEFQKYMNLPAVWMKIVSQVGLISRGIVWIILGGFFINSFLQFTIDDVNGLGEALERVEESSYGDILLTLVAVGLIAFGFYSMLEAKYRTIDLPSPDSVTTNTSKILN